jgi:hypothetical protein
MRRAVFAAAMMAASPLAAADLATFTAKPWGLTVRHPAELSASYMFRPNSFDRGAWRVSYAADTGPGTPIVAFALPELHASNAGGDSTATEELRIGASRDPDVLAGCLTYGMNSGDNAEIGTRDIGGVRFTEVPDNGDGGLSQHIATDDFRALRDGTCWAIDLVHYVGGTSNVRPDYTPEQIARLKAILDTIHFD